MARTHSTPCPQDGCDELVEITPTDIPVGPTGRSMRWRVVMHRGPTGVIVDDLPVIGVCGGSGKLV
jgi:hypothetical protein